MSERRYTEAELRDALLRYGRHSDNCATRTPYTNQVFCDCGWLECKRAILQHSYTPDLIAEDARRRQQAGTILANLPADWNEKQQDPCTEETND